MYSQFWRPKIQNQGVGEATLPLKAQGENPFSPSSSFWRLLAFLGLWMHRSNLCHHLHIPRVWMCISSGK